MYAQVHPGGLACKGYVFKRYVKFDNGLMDITEHYFSVHISNILKSLQSIVLFSDKAIYQITGNNHMSFETNWLL